MLTELRIRNYAVIDDLRVEFGPGLTVLSGETGAGKSIVVGALSLLLGERAASDVIRAGEDRAVVEGVFGIPDDPAFRARCEEAGIDLTDDGIILKRELQREGRNRAWINGSPATAGLIGELGSALVDLHGQHEHQALLRPAPQRRIVDEYAGAVALAREVRSAWARVRDRESELEGLREAVSTARDTADRLTRKAEEIEKAGLEPDEDERLAAEIKRLENSEELLELSGQLHEAVYGDESSMVDRLGELRRTLEGLLRIDPEVGELESLFESGLASLDELGRRLRDYRYAVEHDPGRLASLRQRRELIAHLRRTYGGTVEELIEAGREARTELLKIETSEAEVGRLQDALTEARAELEALADRLGSVRRTAAERLEREVTDQLSELGLPGGRFKVDVAQLDAPGPDGAETISFLVSLNPGFEPGPLGRVASGGELSRVMLALKSVLADADAVPSLVFDEIDSGVGGQVAHAVADRLGGVADSHQVFAITHLAQIAARADTQYRVEKIQRDGVVATRVVRLSEEERPTEISRMLGGDPESEVSLRHAKELLERRDPVAGEELRTAEAEPAD
ncbi:MAG: DNA repair protein RecN [marine benthic group bacterium]|jgi:DNA repair protein RecN (Recombination protein N)|nr:DNA repair protein RecN [Candidatus Carthagonibacter metallireducens]MCL7966937.1 DNA repair protein RecN [Gemmatimonadota bacterium]MCL7984388.1 DNA repair protein RecN [Gemmatimonadota bacterium]MCL7990843.1 DNA repair protein RecN [Gemmatimonadota bacterium]